MIDLTDWTALNHAGGPATDTPAALRDLLEGSHDAVRHLEVRVAPPNTIYSSTAAALEYVTEALADQRTAPLRVRLLTWVASVAETASGSSATAAFADLVGVRALRPALFDAVRAFLSSPDAAVRHAATRAATHLLHDPSLIDHSSVENDMVPHIPSELPDYDSPLPAFTGPAESPDSVINETDWAPLWHATNHPTTDTPVLLKRLLFRRTQPSALTFLTNALSHQNSLYPATVPAVRYVAAVLGNPRVASVRAELLTWLSGILRDLDDSEMACGEAEYAHLLPMRPALADAASPFTLEADRDIQYAAQRVVDEAIISSRARLERWKAVRTAMPVPPGFSTESPFSA